MIDNYDSFVHNLVRYFVELGQDIVTYRNDEISIADIKKLNPKGIIISPGPKTPIQAGICLDVVEHFKGRIPILGICLGHQVIANHLGAEIIQAETPAHGKVSNVHHDNSGIFRDIANPIKVTRYHSLVVNAHNIPEDVTVTGRTDDGVIMGIRSLRYELEGVQFHPEAHLTEQGHDMINNFINRCTQYYSEVSNA